jgi:hypothetical protein
MPKNSGTLIYTDMTYMTYMTYMTTESMLKVKLTLEQAMKAETEITGIALLFL